jgi:hypothetical protein
MQTIKLDRSLIIEDLKDNRIENCYIVCKTFSEGRQYLMWNYHYNKGLADKYKFANFIIFGIDNSIRGLHIDNKDIYILDNVKNIIEWVDNFRIFNIYKSEFLNGHNSGGL